MKSHIAFDFFTKKELSNIKLAYKFDLRSFRNVSVDTISKNSNLLLMLLFSNIVAIRNNFKLNSGDGIVSSPSIYLYICILDFYYNIKFNETYYEVLKNKERFKKETGYDLLLPCHIYLKPKELTIGFNKFYDFYIEKLKAYEVNYVILDIENYKEHICIAR